MPNICSFSLKVKGKKNNVDTFIKIMQCEYDCQKNEFSYGAHFSRIFDAYVESIVEVDGETYAVISGSCAWSVYSCMFSGTHTYYDDFCEEDNRVTHIEEITSLYDLVVEIYSEEPGCCFQEHYIVDAGSILESETVNYYVYYYDGEYDEELGTVMTEEHVKRFNEEYETTYTLEDYNEDMEAFVDGGFGEWLFSF